MSAIRNSRAKQLQDGSSIANNTLVIIGPPLGVGTFAIVYRCRKSCGKGMEMALKVVRKQYFSALELEILTLIKDHEHMHCATFIRFFLWGSHRCLLMPIYGPHLLTLLQQSKDGRMELNLIKCVLRGVLVALQFLDSLSIIHTDIKPENIVLMQANQYNQPILIDFGGAVFDNNKNNTLVTTPQYRAPEVEIGVVRGYGIDTSILWDSKIDIWGLGCVAYELWQGNQLFIDGDPELSLLDQMRDRVGPLPFPVSTHRVRLTEVLRETPCTGVTEIYLLDFICMCLTAKAEKRPSASQMLKHGFLGKH